MSRENLETVRAVYERWREGDFHSTANLLDSHVGLVLDPRFAASIFGPSHGGNAYYGAEAVAAYTWTLLEPMRHLTMEAEETIEAGNSVLVAVRQQGAGSASGAPIEIRYFTLWTFRGRKVIRIESFTERGVALEAAGLSD